MSLVNLTKELEPQATLALFFGGTGVSTGTMLVRMLETVPEPACDFVEPFLIDSQAPKSDSYERSRHYCYRDLNRFHEPVYEEFRSGRMPENLGREPVMDSSDGCGVTRIFGAASLAECRDDFTKLLSGAYRRLQERRSDKSQPLQVFLTASTCGGTGAGMLIDAAALIRHHLAENFGERPRIYAFLIGPDAFDGKVEDEQKKDRMMASAYGLLKELHRFADGGIFRSGYRLRDKPIEIRNDSSGDRLFEWVFYSEGQTEAGPVVRSLEEQCWIVAEFQLHFALSLVGRKIRESIPNLREQRARRYPADFIHPESREARPPEEAENLRRASRCSFLAGLAIRSVRIPGSEVADFERARWCVEAIESLLERTRLETAEPVEVLDRVLGIRAGEATRDGLLDRWGATTGTLRRHLQLSGWTPPGRSQEPKSVQAGGEALLRRLDGLLQARDSAGDGPVQDDIRQAFESWRLHWRSVSENSGLAGYLFPLAGDATEGRGLRWLQALLGHLIEFLETPQPVALLDDEWERLESLQKRVRQRQTKLRKALLRDARDPRVLARRQLNRWTANGSSDSVYSDRARKDAENAAKELQYLAETAERVQRETAIPELKRLVYRHMADDLKEWRRKTLDPTLEVLTAAEISSRARLHRCRTRIDDRHPQSQGGDERLSVRSLADEEFLKAFRHQAISQPSMIDLVVRPFFESGLVSGRSRLSIHSIREASAEELVRAVDRVVTEGTRARLESLGLGWHLPAASSRLGEAAAVLDAGAKPLVAYAEGAVGLTPLRYLLKPADLELQNPFGQSFEGVEQFAGRDPTQLTVVSVVLGIPPNTLSGIARWFRQYCLHLGDHHAGDAMDRYPLHVFRSAALDFDEPYSPLDICRHPNFVEGLCDLVQSEVWDRQIELEVRLESRKADPLGTLDDWNVVIELADRVVRAARHRPDLEEAISADVRLTPLARRLRGHDGDELANASNPPI